MLVTGSAGVSISVVAYGSNDAMILQALNNDADAFFDAIELVGVIKNVTAGG